MALKSDAKRPGGINADFDDSFSATSLGGGVIFEQVLRSLGIRRMLDKHLPSRGLQGGYSALDCALATIVGVLCGGSGFCAAERLREDPVLAAIFGFTDVPEEATQYRAMCDLAGLEQRRFADTYTPTKNDVVQTRLDVCGKVKEPPKHRRLVPKEPEAMGADRVISFDKLVAASAIKCAGRLGLAAVRLGKFLAIHGDATEIEVKGRCFDAAKINHEGNNSLRWFTIKLGPVTMTQEAMAGASDEGRNMPRLLQKAQDLVLAEQFRRIPPLGLMDGAYCEKPVLEKLREMGWKYIVGANQMRPVLTRIAEELPETEWHKTGADTQRGWSKSEVCVFVHQAETWEANETVVCRRYQKTSEIEGLWEYAFVVTNLDPKSLPPDLVKKYGFAQAIWMYYGTKQGHENNYKIPLTDLDLHHPPSGRLGAMQVFYALASVAANILAVVLHKVVPKGPKGKRPCGRLGTFLRRFVMIPAYIVRTAGRRLQVMLAGADLPPERKAIWRQALANAARL